ncbi:ubiquitin-like protein 3 [Pelecanus crispus]|uniref:ubiquitin-like protein 3 n=1 Tax=Pelecanus crispus TaxID=36300 RepID=UPI003F5D0348
MSSVAPPRALQPGLSSSLRSSQGFRRDSPLRRPARWLPAAGMLMGKRARTRITYTQCAGPHQRAEIRINLRLILVSGKTKEFLFSPNDSAADIAKHVYDNWPMDWEEEQVSSPNILRLIYQGRFLHGNVTLGALKLPFGKTTVMHLVARETLPEPNSQGQRNREKTGESNCCVIL